MHVHYLRFLISVPLLTYAVSYLYLAFYHGKSLLFNVVVHEGGTYSLLQSTFYASHFLGHIPVHVVLAFFFTGCYLCLSDDYPDRWSKGKMQMLSAAFILFLIAATVLSVTFFGFEDALSFIAQEKQGVGIYREGGAWNLHLPSTILLFALIPVYIYFIKRICGRSVQSSMGGVFYLAVSCFFFIAFTLLSNRHNISGPLCLILTDARYLAHGVRELLTFPVTYFPIPLYFFLRGEKGSDFVIGSSMNRKVKLCVALLSLIFIAGLFYEASIPLSKGIGNLAQKPAFAKGGKLGIPYLLAAHYFEHFLDTIFFALLCLLLYGLASRSKVLLSR